MAKRKDGVHFAEQQLVPLIVPTIVGVAGLILYGFTAESPQSSSSWGIIMGMAAEISLLETTYIDLELFLGWTLYNFAFISTIIVTTSYASEVMPSNPGSYTC